MEYSEVIKTILTCLGGGTVVLGSLFGFLSHRNLAKYKSELDAVNKKLEKQNEHKVYVSKELFDIELKTYLKLSAFFYSIENALDSHDVNQISIELDAYFAKHRLTIDDKVCDLYNKIIITSKGCNFDDLYTAMRNRLESLKVIK